MRYNIVSIDNSRSSYKECIRSNVKHINEVRIPSINARIVDLNAELESRGLRVTSPDPLSIGEIGIWLSMIDCWQWSVDNNEEILVFEDDAIPSWDFDNKFMALMSDVPEDYDFVCLWVPSNQIQDYTYNVSYDQNGAPSIYGHLPPGMSFYSIGAERAARVYNGYGNVAQLFSPKGSKFFIDRARSAGIYTPVDCYQYLEAHSGRCDGYAPKPGHATLVGYDWPETTVHNTEEYTQ